MTEDLNRLISSAPVQGALKEIAEYPKEMGVFESGLLYPQKPCVLGTAVKFDKDKVPMHLLSNEALKQIAAVLDFGQNKYAAHNWRNGFVWSRVLGAAMRHLHAFNDGEDKDPESGLSHLAHAGCCIMFLLEFEKTHKELDDRYKVNFAHNEEENDE